MTETTKISDINDRIDNMIKEAEATTQTTEEQFNSIANVFNKFNTHLGQLREEQKSMSQQFTTVVAKAPSD